MDALQTWQTGGFEAAPEIAAESRNPQQKRSFEIDNFNKSTSMLAYSVCENIYPAQGQRERGRSPIPIPVIARQNN